MSIICILVTAMPTRISIIHRIIPAVSIQVQTIPPVGVLLGEARYHRVVVSGPQVVLLADGGILLAVELKAVLHRLFTEGQVPPCVVFIAVRDILPISSEAQR